MDSITKLQSKLAEAENILKYVSKELNGYAQDKSVGSNLNFAEIKLRGEQYSFYEHPLKNQIFQDEYFALMIYVISLGGKKEEGWTILYRIAAGCDYQKDLQYLTTDAMTFTEERLSEIIRLIYSADMARTFALDSLMICFHMGADDAQLQFLAGVYELLKIDKDFLTEAMQFVKVLDATYWDNLAEKSKVWNFLTAKDVATYIIDAYPATSIEEAAQLNYKRVGISGITYTSKDVLNLDDWQADEILFINCKFENCGGIYSQNKSTKFIGCKFEGNLRHNGGSNYKYRAFLQFTNAEFLNCFFMNFEDVIPMLNLSKGLIHLCAFKKCRQHLYSSMLLSIRDSNVSETKFESCDSSLDTYYSCNKSGDSCMIYSLNSMWSKSSFFSCQNFSHNDGMCSGILSFIIFLDKNSCCQLCSFENNNAYGKTHDVSYSDIQRQGYTIGLRESKQIDNNGNFSVDEIKYISKDIFIVGDKHYDN